jgi:putative N-acetyltransferase (TIGR04045 family)
MARRRPPDPEIMKDIYTAVGRILKKKGLSQRQSKAGCVRCGACSALPLYENRDRTLACHSARTDDEEKQAFGVRKEVFVVEQGIFKDTDVDDHDAFSTHLVAKIDGRVVGTVRVFPTGENGSWVGGRLAVSKSHRVDKVGATLVKEAMKRVKKKGCTDFTAHIQEKNIDFFKRLGWKPAGPMATYHDRPHQLMRADLDRVPGDGEPM